MVTAGTYQKEHFFDTDEKLDALQSGLLKIRQETSVEPPSLGHLPQPLSLPRHPTKRRRPESSDIPTGTAQSFSTLDQQT